MGCDWVLIYAVVTKFMVMLHGTHFESHGKTDNFEISFLLCSSVANVSEKDGMHHVVNKTNGIITLYRHQRAAFAITSKRGPAPKLPKTSSNDLPPGSSVSTETDEVFNFYALIIIPI